MVLTFPNIKLVSRDGASTYASAVTNSHPNAVQISDRFHFIKALSEAVDKYIRRTFPSRVEIPATECITEEMRALYDTSNRSMRIRFAQKKRKEGLTTNEIALLLHSSPKTISKYLAIPEDEIPEDCKILKEREHQLAIQQKQKEIEEAKRLSAEGYSIQQIGIMMHHTAKTIRSYLDPSYSVINGHYDNRLPGKLAPYEKEVIELRSRGITYREIHEIICAKGYSGSIASLRMFIQKERAHAKNLYEQSKEQKEYIQRKSLCQLIYKKLEDIPFITEKQYDAVIEKYPLLGNLYALVKEFYRIVFSQKPDDLNCWFDTASSYEILEM